MRERTQPREEVAPPPVTTSLLSVCLWTSGLLHQRCGEKLAHSFDGIR
jgi:hypothetical protein